MQAHRIEIDLYADWVSLLRRKLESAGYHIDDDLAPYEVALLYHNVELRLIPEMPRRILVSREFTCPKKYRDGLKALKRKILRGDNLTPYLSKKIREATYNDLLLNHWGISHFHLGLSLKEDGFVQRTGPLLYAYIKNCDAYLIDVMNHQSFSEPKLVSIIEANWPELLKPMMSRPGTKRHAAGEIHSLRRAGMMPLPISSDGGVAYFPPGMGYTNSGMSLKAQVNMSARARKIASLERWTKNNINEIVLAAQKRGIAMGPEFNFRLVDNQEGWAILEELSNVEFSFY